MPCVAALHTIFAFIPSQRNHSQALVAASPHTRLLAEMSEQGVQSDKVTVRTRRALSPKELEEETPRNSLTAHCVACRPFRVIDIAATSLVPPTLNAARWWLEKPDAALPVKVNAHMVKGVLQLDACSLFTNYLVGLDVHSACRLTAIEGLSACRLVERVNVSHCRLLKDFSFLASVPTLRHVNVASTRHLVSLGFLLTSPFLETLDVSECHNVKDWSALVTLSRLRRLCARLSSLDSVAWAVSCTALEELDVSNCEHVKDIKPLASLRRLALLIAQGSSVSDLEGLTCCSRLERLCVYDDQITGEKGSEHKALLERSGTVVLAQ